MSAEVPDWFVLKDPGDISLDIESGNRFANDRLERLISEDLWIISKGRYADLDLSRIYEGANPGLVREYGISDLAFHMLNPNPKIQIWRGKDVHQYLCDA